MQSKTLSNWDVSGSTHCGGRASNEDAFSVLMNKRLLVVADGMGGHSGGALASAAACLSVQKEADCYDAGEKPDIQAFLRHCTARAHEAITALNGDRRGRERMGSTLTMVYLDDAEMHMVWVGDSRVYLLRAGELIQLTVDHSLPYQPNVITRSLGHNSAQPDYRKEVLKEGDIVLLCSDGLNNTLSEAVLLEKLSAAANAAAIDESLMQAALAGSPKDNVTVLVAKHIVPPAAPPYGSLAALANMISRFLSCFGSPFKRGV